MTQDEEMTHKLEMLEMEIDNLRKAYDECERALMFAGRLVAAHEQTIQTGHKHIEKLISENEALQLKLYPFDEHGQFKEPYDFRKAHFEENPRR